MRSANEERLLVALIETAQGVERADEIAAVDGVDVLWIGQFDLTNSMGIPGRPWYRHLVYAPKFTYAPELLPGVTEALAGGRRAAAGAPTM